MENLEFTCVGLNDNGKFPAEYTGRGEDISPEFIINNLSPNAETLIITLEDMSHPIKRFTHWVIWNIPAANSESNSARKIGGRFGERCTGDRLRGSPLCGSEASKGKDPQIPFYRVRS